jgi:hypothetical protein
MKYIIFKELFYSLTGSLAIFTILEIIHPGLVLAYINLNWLLIFWLIIGIFIVVWDQKNLRN